MFGLPAVLLAAGGWYWLTSGGSVSTDNAYVQMDKVSIAAEVGGRITEVAVKDGQMVQKGQLLFRIDGEPYALSVAQANAAILHLGQHDLLDDAVGFVELERIGEDKHASHTVRIDVDALLALRNAVS